MRAVEEIINVHDLVNSFSLVVRSGKLQDVMDEIVVQSKVEFNYNEDDDTDDNDAEQE